MSLKRKLRLSPRWRFTADHRRNRVITFCDTVLRYILKSLLQFGSFSPLYLIFVVFLSG